jgi:D-tyrosyl-tRNA(Tyr) deacylase
MRIILQRVSKAQVKVADVIVGDIGEGLLLLVGIGQGDTEANVMTLADKIVHLRIFEDEAGKMNRSLLDIEGGALVVSQFTLYADTSRGRRPNFIGAAPPTIASPLIDRFAHALGNLGVKSVATGQFGAHMDVSLINNGPVTIILEG